MEARAAWERAKAECPAEYVLLVRDADFYVAFGEDAQAVASAAGMGTYRSEGVERFGVPYGQVERVLESLLRSGRKVAVADELAG